MKFNSRHKQALEFFAAHQDGVHRPPPGVGDKTVKELEKNGYLSSERTWIDRSYKITEKGLGVVGKWTEETGETDAQKRLDKWNKSVQGKG